MAKGKNNDLMPALAGIFCFFIVFLKCLAMLGGSTWKLNMLLMPALWLLLGLCLMVKGKKWLALAGMLPLTILMVQSVLGPLAMGSVQVFLSQLVCSILPAVSFVVLFLLLFLACVNTGYSLRREMWLVPILLTLPGCIWQHGSTLVWAQLGVVACITLWIRPAGK